MIVGMPSLLTSIAQHKFYCIKLLFNAVSYLQHIRGSQYSLNVYLIFAAKLLVIKFIDCDGKLIVLEAM
jgi:hypothetical protein